MAIRYRESVLTAANSAGWGDRFDPFSEPIRSDPHTFLAAARAATPVFYSAGLGHWVVTRYADVKSVLADARSFSAANVLDPIQPLCPYARAVLRDAGLPFPVVLINADPPAHTRVRRAVNAAFTPRRVAAMAADIRSLAQRLVDEHFVGRRTDLIRSLAWELPARVVFGVIGVPRETIPRIKADAQRRIQFIWGRPTDSEQVALAEDSVRMWTFVRDFVHDRQIEPRDDFTSDLLHPREPGHAALSEIEVATIVFGLLIAGHETTTCLIGHAARWLLANNGVWAGIVADRALIENAIEEVLRIEPPTASWRRRTLQPSVFGDASIPAGANLLVSIAAANRDPAVFDRPDSFDIRRRNAKDHLSFGIGAHFCLGAPLARLEARIVVDVLAERFPSLRLTPDQTGGFLPNLAFREPLSVEVEWD